MNNFYNPTIKNRFLTENNLNQIQNNKWKIIFSKTKPQEEILQKDIYQMNKEECESLLHFFNLRSVQHVNMHITNFKYYIYWCDSQGLIPHHLNHFEGLGDRETAKTFISNQVMKNQVVSKEKIDIYTNRLLEVKDYQGALILCLLFLGVTLDQNDNKCELRNIRVNDIDFQNKTIKTNKKILDINDNLITLIRNAITQEEMINLVSMEPITSKNQNARKFNNHTFLINGRRTGVNVGTPTAYFYVTKKIREMGSFLNNPHINGSYLNLSGMLEYIKNNYSGYDYDKYDIYEDLIKIYVLEISKEALKQKMIPFLT